MDFILSVIENFCGQRSVGTSGAFLLIMPLLMILDVDISCNFLKHTQS